ncbi:MAG: hypothetical protein CM1200mP13_02750 [Candidatus Pelagibacterales bacterium]|nr:MAG: hypothetical protein CM1200mP13_02750 [Pelagibacterales bacterium]
MELVGSGVLIDGKKFEKVQELTKGKGSEAFMICGEKGSTAMGIQMTSMVVFTTLLVREEIKSLQLI